MGDLDSFHPLTDIYLRRIDCEPQRSGRLIWCGAAGRSPLVALDQNRSPAGAEGGQSASCIIPSIRSMGWIELGPQIRSIRSIIHVLIQAASQTTHMHTGREVFLCCGCAFGFGLATSSKLACLHVRGLSFSFSDTEHIYHRPRDRDRSTELGPAAVHSTHACLPFPNQRPRRRRQWRAGDIQGSTHRGGGSSSSSSRRLPAPE